MLIPNTWINFAAAAWPIASSWSCVHGWLFCAAFSPVLMARLPHVPNCACAVAARRTNPIESVISFFMFILLAGLDLAFIGKRLDLRRRRLHLRHLLRVHLVFTGRILFQPLRIDVAIAVN